MAEKPKPSTHAVSQSRAKPKPIVEESQGIYGAISKIATWVAIALAVVVVGVVMLLKYYESNSSKTVAGSTAAVNSDQRTPGDCTFSRPCVLGRYTDGSTETVTVKLTDRVCFDPPPWNDLDRLKLMVASQGVPEHQFACNVEVIMSGQCKEPHYTRFRFMPNPGVMPPRYWFTSDPTIVCG